MRLTTGLVLALVFCTPLRAARAGEPPWNDLFDGKTLRGWVQRGGNAKYEVKDGTIVGTSVPNTKNSFLCTERSYGDFVLEVEFKADPQLNSGIQIRGQSSPDYQQGRVHGYQVEIDPDVKRGRMWTGGLYDEGRRGWLVDLKDNDAARRAFKPDEWNHLRVDARGDSIKTWLNGVPAADLVDSMDLEGFIGLQVHQVASGKSRCTSPGATFVCRTGGAAPGCPCSTARDCAASGRPGRGGGASTKGCSSGPSPARRARPACCSSIVPSTISPSGSSTG
jgi:hypothetical protein